MDTVWVAILVSSLGMIGGWLSSSLTTYINTKSQYKAMLEDIGEITETVKGVEKRFQDDTEKVKSQLSVLTNKHNILFTEEKEALLAYLSAWNIWHSKLNRMASNYKTYNYPELDDILKSTKKLHKENDDDYDRIQMCLSKLELFLNDERIIKSIYTLNNKTQEFQALNETHISNFIWNNNKKVSLIAELPLDRTKPNPDIVNAIEALQNLMYREDEEYRVSMLKIYGEVSACKHDFISLSKEYIRKGIS